MKKQEYTIKVDTEKNAQVLNRILNICSRRGVGIDSMYLLPVFSSEYRQLQFVVDEEETTIKKLINQIDKQIDVRAVTCFVKKEI